MRGRPVYCARRGLFWGGERGQALEASKEGASEGVKHAGRDQRGRLSSPSLPPSLPLLGLSSPCLSVILVLLSSPSPPFPSVSKPYPGPPFFSPPSKPGTGAEPGGTMFGGWKRLERRRRKKKRLVKEDEVVAARRKGGEREGERVGREGKGGEPTRAQKNNEK